MSRSQTFKDWFSSTSRVPNFKLNNWYVILYLSKTQISLHMHFRWPSTTVKSVNSVHERHKKVTPACLSGWWYCYSRGMLGISSSSWFSLSRKTISQKNCKSDILEWNCAIGWISFWNLKITWLTLSWFGAKWKSKDTIGIFIISFRIIVELDKFK